MSYITATYTCPHCAVREREIAVLAREDEGFHEWMECTMIPTLAKDHGLVSPRCCSHEFDNVRFAKVAGQLPGRVMVH